MALNHGINTYKADTNFATIRKTAVGIPFFVGAWPCHTAGGFKSAPQLAYSFREAQDMGGYSDEWRTADGAPKWSLCQAMYSHFKIFGAAPAVFCNVFNPAVHKRAVASADKEVADHVVTLPADAIDDAGLVVKAGTTTLVKDTDYETSYDEGSFIIELLPESDSFSAETLNVAYNEANPSAIEAADVEEAIEHVENCKALFGVVPDLICCPGWSQTPAVAAVMAAKAANINGLFKGKAVVDIEADASTEYISILTAKQNGYTDPNMIVCWPLLKVGERLFDFSVLLCGHIAQTDGKNDCPYESPSNKLIPITACVKKDGSEVNLSVQQADCVSYNAGVVTAMNFDGWRVWGNYTGCWPGDTDVSRCFICTSRMMDFICNTFVYSYWEYIDRPLSRVTIDAIVNSFNSYLNGLTHENKLYGGEIQYVGENNPDSELIAGRFRLDVTMASPVPAQRIDMYAEFSVEMLHDALAASAGKE